ncbi:MAG: primosomal replication protein N [Burkholderiaceae bacterium]
MNQLQLSAKIIERQVLRYTPAGIPVAECVLQHQSAQIEAQQARQVELEIRGMAIGSIAASLNQAPLGRRHRFVGFLAKRSRNSRSFVYHITAFELENED